MVEREKSSSVSIKEDIGHARNSEPNVEKEDKDEEVSNFSGVSDKNVLLVLLQ